MELVVFKLINMIEYNTMVSIITPSFNSSRFIAESIESVLNQTYQNWELLITDDCSIDNSVEIIASYTNKDSRIRLFPLKSNVGAAAARNVSIKNSTGRYIAFLDSDDIWMPEKLERQIAFMQQKGYAFTCSAYDQMTEQGEKLNKIVVVPQNISYHQYLRNTIIGCLTVTIDRYQTGDFTMPIIRSSHDMALWLLIMKRGFKCYGFNEVLATYRLVTTSNSSKKISAAKDVWKVYTEMENLTVFEALYNFLGYVFNAIRKRI